MFVDQLFLDRTDIQDNNLKVSFVLDLVASGGTLCGLLQPVLLEHADAHFLHGFVSELPSHSFLNCEEFYSGSSIYILDDINIFMFIYSVMGG